MAALIDSAGKLLVVRFDRRGNSTPLAVRSEPGKGSTFSARFPPQRLLPALVADRREA